MAKLNVNKNKKHCFLHFNYIFEQRMEKFDSGFGETMQLIWSLDSKQIITKWTFLDIFCNNL